MLTRPRQFKTKNTTMQMRREKMDPGAVFVFVIRAMAAKWGWEARGVRVVYWYQRPDGIAIRIMCVRYS